MRVSMPDRLAKKGDLFRARVDFEAFNDAKLNVRDLALRAGIDFEPTKHGYPHFYYLDDPAPRPPTGFPTRPAPETYRSL